MDIFQTPYGPFDYIRRQAFGFPGDKKLLCLFIGKCFDHAETVNRNVTLVKQKRKTRLALGPAGRRSGRGAMGVWFAVRAKNFSPLRFPGQSPNVSLRALSFVGIGIPTYPNHLIFLQTGILSR